MRVLLVCEEITSQPREGTLVFLMHLARLLHRESELTVLHAVGETETGLKAARELSPRTFLTRKALRRFACERFDVVLYVPFAGLTRSALARAGALKLLAKRPTVVIALQERPGNGPGPASLLLGRPDLVLSPVRAVRERLERFGIDTGLIIPGYDDRLFRPVSAESRARLKGKYGLPRDRFVLLHVGHLRESRNLEVLLRYRDWGPDVQPAVKAGAVDPSWARRLRTAGIIVIDEYFRDVHELYQASDAYIFPVTAPGGAVELPLSVIEACACNLPVLATRFGLLPEMLREGGGLAFYDRSSEIAGALAALRRSRPETSAKVRELSWDAVLRARLMPRLVELAARSRERTRH
jgi:glycosyltransferase involved in cell wall biosynthesis